MVTQILIIENRNTFLLKNVDLCETCPLRLNRLKKENGKMAKHKVNKNMSTLTEQLMKEFVRTTRGTQHITVQTNIHFC